MATTRRRTDAPVREILFQEAHRFEFFQAVRLLEWVYRSAEARREPVGRDATPGTELVRFRTTASFNFPASAILSLKEFPPPAEAGRTPPPPEMQVTFMGLTGPHGVLPEHYTGLLIRRIRLKDYALRDFLDLFNHRSISLFYRAWEKYRLPFSWERARLDPTVEDWFTQGLRCLIGLGPDHLSGRLGVDDEVPLYYAGHFAHRPRSAIALEALLSDYLGLPVQVKQFQGQWLYLNTDEQTRLPGSDCPAGQYLQLGEGAIVGERVWDVRSRFHLRVGSLHYRRFVRLLPDGDDLLSICELTRTYAGPEFVFAVQPVLEAAEVPACRLEDSADYKPRLGWNTWLGEAALAGEIDAAVFVWRDLEAR